MTTIQLSKTELFTRGQFLTKSLRDEGRTDDAMTVASLINALDLTGKPKYLTTGEVAKKLGVTRQTIVNWINKGSLDGVRLGGRMMIPQTALSEFDDILNVFESSDHPQATDEEINAALASGREGWTWIGKEE